MPRAVGLLRSMPWWMVWAFLAPNVPAAAVAHSVGATEYEVKAAFLFNFSQFVSWPASSFTSPSAPIVIGVLGEDPFGEALDEVVRGERVNGRSLEVRRYAEVQDVGTCHILFIPHERAPPLDEILEGLSGRNILTVGDSRDFAERGGVIGLVTVQHRVRLRVNLGAARAADLTISSKLLRPAEIVASESGRSLATRLPAGARFFPIHALQGPCTMAPLSTMEVRTMTTHVPEKSLVVHEVYPYIRVREAAKAIEFYRRAFGAEELFRLTEPGGRIGHAELRLGKVTLMLSDEYPELPCVGPQSLGGTTFSLHLHVDDADAWIARAAQEGAAVIRPAADHFYGERSGTVRDPFGHEWMIGHQTEEVTSEEMQRRYTKLMTKA